MTGPREMLTRRRALASLGVLAGLTGTGCASSKATTPGVPEFTARPKPGTLLWQRSQPLVNGESVLGVVPAGGVLCVGDGFGNVYGLNAATGFPDGVVRALSPATGAGVWQRRTGGEVFDVTPGPGVVYVSDAFPPGTIYALWT